MKQDKETKNKLLASAKAEFLEKGYSNASLRNICKNAGVTTGALYFFFKDKADLYETLVKSTVETIYTVMNSHFLSDRDSIRNGALQKSESLDDTRDYEDSAKILHLMYEHRDEVLMLLTKSQGSPYEHILERFIGMMEQHYADMAREMEQMNPGKKIDDNVIHWLSHQQIELYVYMITHITDERQAFKFLEQSVSYMIAGWYELFSVK